jgi:hypothetical protein
MVKGLSAFMIPQGLALAEQEDVGNYQVGAHCRQRDIDGGQGL